MGSRHLIPCLMCVAVLATVGVYPDKNATAGVGVQVVTGSSIALPLNGWNDNNHIGLRGYLGLGVISPNGTFKLRLTGTMSDIGQTRDPKRSFGSLDKPGAFEFSGGQLQLLWTPLTEMPVQPYACAGYGRYNITYHPPRSYHGSIIHDDAIEAGLGVDIPWGPLAFSLETTYFHFASPNSLETLYFTGGLSYRILR